ncbi:MAG: hypothetical protein WCF36_11855 [Candidatus Nanopelagicales bacterium]
MSNSFTQFVPEQVRVKDLGKLVALATHPDRRGLFEQAGRLVVEPVAVSDAVRRPPANAI